MRTRSAIDTSTHVAVPDHVLFREIDGEAVLLDLESERYFGLDPTGTAMWKAIVARPALGDAVGDLLALYDVDRSALERDLVELTARLVGHGLLEIDP